MPRVFLLAGTAFAALGSVVNAHTFMTVPKPTFPKDFYLYMNPVMRIDSTKMEPTIPGWEGVKKITAVMAKQANLRSFIMNNGVLNKTAGAWATKECGWGLADGEKQPVPPAVDFIWGHPGPCEVWCDNTKIFYNGDCMGNNVGKVPLNGKCNGAKMLQAMYVGTHLENWEVYSTYCYYLCGVMRV
jgi:hypothetical protein